MANRRYQILKKPRHVPCQDQRPVWSFVAHGATYAPDEADETVARLNASGSWIARKLAL